MPSYSIKTKHKDYVVISNSIEEAINTLSISIDSIVEWEMTSIHQTTIPTNSNKSRSKPVKNIFSCNNVTTKGNPISTVIINDIKFNIID